MKHVEGWKSVLFVSSLAGIALFINSRQQRAAYTPSPSYAPQPGYYEPTRAVTPTKSESANVVPKQSAPEPSVEESVVAEQRAQEQREAARVVENQLALAQRAAEEKKAAHARFLERNLNPGFTRRSVPTFAVVSATADGKLNAKLTSNLIRRLATNGVEFASSLFTPAFVSDGNFQALADGSNELISRLELTNAFDGLVLAKEAVGFETTPSLENLITASLQLDVSIIYFTGHNDRQTFSWNANGPGFRQNDARLAAEERILKQIARDANFHLNPMNASR